jgi:hypothetical protein
MSFDYQSSSNCGSHDTGGSQSQNFFVFRIYQQVNDCMSQTFWKLGVLTCKVRKFHYSIYESHHLSPHRNTSMWATHTHTRTHAPSFSKIDIIIVLTHISMSSKVSFAFQIELCTSHNSHVYCMPSSSHSLPLYHLKIGYIVWGKIINLLIM